MNSITLILVCALALVLPALTYEENGSKNGIAAYGYRRRVRCRLPFFPHCHMVSRLCPYTCPYSCLMDCSLCRPVCRCNMPGAVCQDPRFVGGDGLTFYFHGHKNSDFCLVTDKNLHINAHFIGKRNDHVKRDFTWVQSLGILFDSHKLYVGDTKTGFWDDKVDCIELAFDGQSISLPLVEGNSATYTSKVNVGAAMSVLGGEDKFSSSHIFATDCAVSKFTGETDVSREQIEAKDHPSHRDGCNDYAETFAVKRSVI